MATENADKLFADAEKARSGSRYVIAVNLYLRAFACYTIDGNAEGALDCRIALADTCRMTGDFEDAIKYYSEALATAIDPPARADCSSGIGLAYRALGDWKAALEHLQAADVIYLAENDKRGHAFVTWAIAGTHRIHGNIDKAIETFAEALKAYEKLKDRRGAGYCHNGLGGANRIAGRFKESERHYTKANKIFENMKDRFGTAYSYCGLGNARRMSGDFKGALAYFRKAESRYKRIGDRVSYAYTLWSMATTSKMLGKLSAANERYEQAETLFRATRDQRGLVYCKLGYGELRLLEGNRTAAARFFRNALKKAEEFGFEVEASHARLLLGIPTGYEKLGIYLEFGEAPYNLP